MSKTSSIISKYDETTNSINLDNADDEISNKINNKTNIKNDAKKSRTLFSNSETRKQCFEEFLHNMFGKEPQSITREELLLLEYKDFVNNDINKTSMGSAKSLYNWFAKQKLGKNIIFSILEDTGYAQKHNIIQEDIKKSVSQKISDGHDIFSNKQNRLECFEEFLHKMFGKEPQNVSREELLSLTRREFKIKEINKSSVGSAVSLYNWFRKQKLGKNAIFSILEDTGYAQKHNITQEDVKLAVLQKLKHKKIVVVDRTKKLNTEPDIELNEEVSNKQKDDTVKIEIVTSIQRDDYPSYTYELTTIAKECNRPTTLINQAIEQHFHISAQSSNIIAYTKIIEVADAPIGDKFVIKSNYPLDAIYKQGLQLLGFDIDEKNTNLKLFVDSKEQKSKIINSKLRPYYCTQITKTEQAENNVDQLYFQTHLYPQRILINHSGFFSRMIAQAPTVDAILMLIGQIIEHIKRIENNIMFENGEFSKAKMECENKVHDNVIKRFKQLPKDNRLPIDYIQKKAQEKNNEYLDLLQKHNEFIKKIENRNQKFEINLDNATKRQKLGIK